MTDVLKITDFEPHINSTFEIRFDDGGQVELELVDCSSETREDYDAFSLIFNGANDKPLPQRTYNIRHPELGEQQFFIVPIAPLESEKMTYEVVFNHMKK
ncbi:MAG: hypothetical protein MI863_20170 [Desulfobacterales bacterium]|nr:hypothetical protein [Desulfobacterales bacterium]